MPVTADTILLFAAAGLVLNLTPGADMLYCLSRSVTDGPRGALGAAFGNLIGTLAHTLILVLGLGALLAASSEAFDILRWVAGGALIALGILSIRSGPAEPRTDRPPAPSWRIVSESATIHTLNPKTVVFFAAYLPLFLDADRAATPQIAFLGAWFAAQAAFVLLAIGLSAHVCSGRARTSPTLRAWATNAAGALMILLGARLATATTR